MFTNGTVKAEKSSEFDGDWTGYFITVKGRDSDALCLKGAKFSFSISNGAVHNGFSTHVKYAAARGPGTMSYWGDVSSDGFLRGWFKGGYVVGDWVAVLRKNEIGIGVLEPNMGLTSEPYECPMRMVISRNHSVNELKESDLLRWKDMQTFNKDSFAVPAIGDLEEKLRLNVEQYGGVQSEDYFHYALGLLNGYSLDGKSHSHMQANYDEAAPTSQSTTQSLKSSGKHISIHQESVDSDRLRDSLQELKKLRDEGLIDSDVYKEQQRIILSR